MHYFLMFVLALVCLWGAVALALNIDHVANRDLQDLYIGILVAIGLVLAFNAGRKSRDL